MRKLINFAVIVSLLVIVYQNVMPVTMPNVQTAIDRSVSSVVGQAVSAVTKEIQFDTGVQ
jgi:hypothetical protein